MKNQVSERLHILIAGGCGFIGSNIAVFLKSKNFDIICFDNVSRRGSEHIVRQVTSHGCEFIHGDIRVRDDFSKIPHGIDIFIDCSAEPSLLAGTSTAGAINMLNINVGGSINCFSWCQENRVPVIFLSTSRVYPYSGINSLDHHETGSRFEIRLPATGITPNGVTEAFPLAGRRSMYGASKYCSELILAEYQEGFGLQAIINRCGVVAGPWQMGKTDQGFIMHWLICHHFRKPLNYIGFGGSGKQVRDVLHVADLCELVERQIMNLDRSHGEIYNVGGGRTANCSLLELTDLCREITGVDLAIGSLAENRPGDVRWYISDSTAAQTAFDWLPRRTLRQIVTDSYTWLKSHEDLVAANI